MTQEANTRAGQIAGVHAQLVFKTVATRSDGKKILGAIGLASTAPNDSTGGQSEIILQADRLVFVSSSDPDAPLKNLMEVGLVDGVTTLRIPAAIIGDLTVGRAKILDSAVNTVKIEDGANRAMGGVELITEVSFNATPVDLFSTTVDSAGAPTWVQAVWSMVNLVGLFRTVKFELLVSGTVVLTSYVSLGASAVREGKITKFVGTPGSGDVTYTLRVSTLSGSGPQITTDGTAMFVIGSRR